MISDMMFGVARRLHDRIELGYDALPEVVNMGNVIGFSIGGREVGRVEQKEEHVFATYYAPSKQLFSQA